MGHGLTRISRIFTDTSTPSQSVESVKIRVPRLARSSLAVEAEPQNNALPLGVTAMANDSAGVFRMILFPSLITLAVTVLRLIGELKHWPRTLFNPEPGGGGAIFGISWLAFVFAVYFAARVHKSQQPLEKAGKAIGITLLSLAFCIAGVFLMFRAIQSASLIAWAPSMAVVCGGLYLMRFAWPSYWAVMMAYALAARIPVIAVMYFAIKGNWGTHYDAAGPIFTAAGWWTEFVHTGLLPQLFLWVPYTVVLCGLFGVITAAAVRRRTAAATT